MSSIVEPIAKDYITSAKKLEEARKKLEKLEGLQTKLEEQFPKIKDFKDKEKNKDTKIDDKKTKDSTNDLGKSEEKPKNLEGLVHSLESIGGKGMSDLDILYITGMAFESVLNSEALKQNPEALKKLQMNGVDIKNLTYTTLGQQLKDNDYISINAGNIKANKGLLGFVEDIKIEITPQQINQYLTKAGEAILTKDKPAEWNAQALKAKELLNSKDAEILLKKILSGYGDGLDKLSGTELYLKALMANKMPVNQVKSVYEEFKKNNLSSKVTSLLEVRIDDK